MARYDEDTRVAECQREIQRLRGVVRGLQEELKRYEVIAHNAIVMWREENLYDWGNEEEWREHVMDEVVMDNDEYYRIMSDYEEED